MNRIPDCPKGPIRYLFCFLRQVVIDFRANQGLVLSGAVAYYTLLSIIPIFTLALVAGSHFFSEEQLMTLLRDNLEIVVPGLTETLLAQVSKFLEHRQVIGWVGILVMLFFSSLAFTVVENTMSVIFYHRVAIKRRHFLISAIIPYVFVLILGVGLILITFIAATLQTIDTDSMTFFGWTFRLEGIDQVLLYLLGVIGLIMLFAAIYLVMPIGIPSASHALYGALVATILWEIARHVLIWYFSTLSIVNVVYGSLATAIVSLLSLEVAGMILLFGAQVIATYERMNAKDAESMLE